MAGLTF